MGVRHHLNKQNTDDLLWSLTTPSERTNSTSQRLFIIRSRGLSEDHKSVQHTNQTRPRCRASCSDVTERVAFLPLGPTLRLSHRVRSSHSWTHLLGRTLWLSESESILKNRGSFVGLEHRLWLCSADQCQEIKRPVANDVSPPSAPVHFLSAGPPLPHPAQTRHCTS